MTWRDQLLAIKDNGLVLSVVVRKREGVVFEGKARSVTSLNDVGPFDVLPLHTNFVAVIKTRLNIIDENKQASNFDITRGIIYVKQNVVEVYLGI